MEAASSRAARAGRLLLPAAATLFCLLVLLASGGVRGSDQFWYVADVERLVEEGRAVSNGVFPGPLLSDDGELPRRLLHHPPTLYLVWAAALVLGAYRGWILTNLLASLATALIIRALVRKSVGGLAGDAAAALYLILPITVWQTSQPLLEATIAPLVALMTLVYLETDRRQGAWLVLALLAVLSTFVRSSFLPVLAVLPVVYLVRNRKRFGRRPVPVVATALTLAAIGLVGYSLKPVLFPQELASSPLRALTQSVPGHTDSMSSYFAVPGADLPDEEAPALPHILLRKVVRGLREQFFPEEPTFQLFYLPFNLLLAFSLPLLLAPSTRVERRLREAAWMVILIHGLTICLHLNAFRYLLVPLPVILVTGVTVLARRSRRLASPALLVVLAALVAMIGADLLLARESRRSGRQTRERAERLRPVLEKTIGPRETVAFSARHTSGEQSYLWAGYLLRPRTVLFLDPRRLYEPEVYRRLLETVEPRWLICATDSPLIELLGVDRGRETAALPEPFAGWAIHSMESD